MYAVEVRSHIMIAHSFKGDLFGPAQRLHGATFVIDVAFMRQDLTADGVVVDIGRAQSRAGRCARAARLPQSRRTAAIQGQADDDRVSQPPHFPADGGGRQIRRARARRRRRRTHPRDAARIPCRARLVRRRGVSEALRIDFAYPGDINAPTGGYGYDRRVMREFLTLGCDVRPIALPASFPYPRVDDLAEARRLLSGGSRDALVIDGLAYAAYCRATLIAELSPRPGRARASSAVSRSGARA